MTHTPQQLFAAHCIDCDTPVMWNGIQGIPEPRCPGCAFAENHELVLALELKLRLLVSSIDDAASPQAAAAEITRAAEDLLLYRPRRRRRRRH